jgi:hypothetical protein
MLKKLALFAGVAALFATCAFAQPTAAPTSTLSVNVAAEAGLTIQTSNALLSEGNGPFANFTGSTSYTYYVRSSPTSGSGTITLEVTSDFAPTGGPSVAASGTTGDTLTYSSSATTPATAVTTAQTASTSGTTPVASFGAGAHSLKGGTGGNAVNWTLVNDPAYAVGNGYTATVTWTISAA